jgi:hypothetical protein
MQHPALVVWGRGTSWKGEEERRIRWEAGKWRQWPGSASGVLGSTVELLLVTGASLKNGEELREMRRRRSRRERGRIFESC